MEVQIALNGGKAEASTGERKFTKTVTVGGQEYFLKSHKSRSTGFIKRTLSFEGKILMTWEEGGAGATNVKIHDRDSQEDLALLLGAMFDSLIRGRAVSI